MLDERTCLNICATASVFIAIQLFRLSINGIEGKVKVEVYKHLVRDDEDDDEDDDDWWKRPKRKGVD